MPQPWWLVPGGGQVSPPGAMVKNALTTLWNEGDRSVWRDPPVAAKPLRTRARSPSVENGLCARDFGDKGAQPYCRRVGRFQREGASDDSEAERASSPMARGAEATIVLH